MFSSQLHIISQRLNRRGHLRLQIEPSSLFYYLFRLTLKFLCATHFLPPLLLFRSYSVSRIRNTDTSVCSAYVVVSFPIRMYEVKSQCQHRYCTPYFNIAALFPPGHVALLFLIIVSTMCILVFLCVTESTICSFVVSVFKFPTYY
jgi:hypothetical protein